MSQLTTHILDTTKGKPAAGVRIILWQQINDAWKQLAAGTTNADGRIPDLLPQDKNLKPATYKMVFDTGSYYTNQNLKTFYPEVEIQFTTFDAAHYHVPLLINPFGYNTYRGS